MNFPPAPLSTSAGVSTVFPLWSRMVMGINNVFRSTRPNVTECISRQGETDVDSVLLFKNPSLRRLHNTSPSLLCPIQQSCFWRERRSHFLPISFSGSPLVRISVRLPSFGFEGNHSFYGPWPYVRFVGRWSIFLLSSTLFARQCLMNLSP